MDFKEAVEKLEEGKKIRRREWKDESLHIFMDKCYREEYFPFNYTVDIMISQGWIIIGEEDTFCFSDIIKPLMEGNKVKLEEWPNDCFLEVYKGTKELFMRKISEVDFIPTFECFTSDDWMVME